MTPITLHVGLTSVTHFEKHEPARFEKMKRLRYLFLAILFGMPSGYLWPNEKPNIVIIYADDMGYGDCTVNNPESKIPTPNIDRLAKE